MQYQRHARHVAVLPVAVLSSAIALFAAAGCHSRPEADRPNLKPDPTQPPSLPSPYTETPLYQRSVREIDAYLADLATRQRSFAERIVETARRNIGQPYDLYLLGEAPFEKTDPQPVFNLRASDCMVFTEHALAMSMSDSFPTFLKTLQRIRYKDGQIGVLTRNHYGEADWNANNRWLAPEITDQIGGDRVAHYTQKVDRAGFFKKRYHLSTTIPVQTITESYIPYEAFDARVKSQLKTGDIVCFVKGTSPTSAWVHHYGVIAVMPDGAVHLIQSNVPSVREEPIEWYLARQVKDNAKNDAKNKARHRGMKFLRPVEDPIAALHAVDGAGAPQVSVPAGSPISFDAFVDRTMREGR